MKLLGIETIELDAAFEVIEAHQDDVDKVSFYDVQLSLREILQRYSDVIGIVALSDKYQHDNMILHQLTLTWPI